MNSQHGRDTPAARKELRRRDRRAARAAQLRPRLKRPIQWGKRALSSLRWKELTGKGAPPPIQDSERQLVNDFHRLFYALDTRTWGDTRWLGAQAQKCPLDLWVIQEILVETLPEVVIEVGVCGGGATLFAASVLDHVGGGDVIGVDIDLSQVNNATRQHPRITLVEGSSTDPGIFAQVQDLVDGRRAMVELDSDHSADHVRAELDLYSPLVAPGCYLVVEDTNLNGWPVLPEHGPGPMEALEAWLRTNPPFTRDRSREKYLMTFNPGGYLRRID